ncbi:CpsB/CapC family capsule biosynthesis tyrosine phosphatase [Tissierella praeacuta]|uniref:tyrosine-protein phosphatase n=1 Tax=Tissierella praeacuta TaxID=43131 RepID=UPI003342C732
MIDIHSHILPCVDDGSKDMEMSIEMARMYIESGIKTVIATPHYIEGSVDTSLENNRIVLEELRKELDKEKLDIDILLGNEAYISMDLLKAIEEGKVSTLNGTRYILIELPMFDIPLYVENVIYELLIKGYIPIIAHPERNAKIIEDPNILYNYIDKGALAQLNLPSLEGKYGEKPKITAEILLKHNMIHFLGTDAHTNRGRSPRVKNALTKLESIISDEDIECLTYKNPKFLLEDKAIDIKTPMKYVAKRHLFWPAQLLKKISSIIS